MIRVGDRVKFLTDTGEGIVTAIKGAVVTVEVEDGFGIPVTMDQIVAVAKEEELRAISLIGVSDHKPGRVKRPAKSEEEKREAKPRFRASQRYGKVSLVEDPDEEIIDLNAIRENYRRTVTEVNRVSIEIDRKEQEAEYERTMVVQEKAKPEPQPQKEAPIEPAPEPKAQRPANIPLDELARRMGVKPEKKQEPKPAKKSDIEVVDLHANEILSSTEGMTPGEILTAQMSRFTIVLDAALKSGDHGKIVFIHGVGKGKLKYEMTKLLGRNYPKVAYQDASFREYGYGAIMIFY